MSLASHHRAALPGSSFIAHDGACMSDSDEGRTWDMLWRHIKFRHTPILKQVCGDIWGEFDPWPDYAAAKERARSAARQLRAWYVRGTST